MKPYLDYQGVAVLAHRGGSIESLENTIESFHYSKSLGCEFIETDVQVSSDGIPYIFHDETLTRLLNRDDVFSSLHSNEIDIFKVMQHIQQSVLVICFSICISGMRYVKCLMFDS